MTKPTVIQRNWAAALTALLPVSLIATAIVVMITWNGIVATHERDNGLSVMEWLAIALIDVSLLFGILYFWWIALSDMFVTISDQGISKLHFPKRTLIHWPDVTRVEVLNATVIIASHQKTIRLNRLLLSNSAQIIEVIRHMSST